MAGGAGRGGGMKCRHEDVDATRSPVWNEKTLPTGSCLWHPRENSEATWPGLDGGKPFWPFVRL
jgi:hypothetical protein